MSEFLGSEHLGFHCTSCGACCRSFRVALTLCDLQRLVDGTGLHASTLIDWLSPDDVDMSGEPSSFVELDTGRRLLVLKQQAGACRFLNEQNQCAVYDARPSDCRAFPFALERSDDSIVSLRLLPLAGCEYELGARQSLRRIAETDEERWSELRAYQARVAEWNRWARHRRRLGRRAGSEAAFLAFLGFG